MTLYGISDIKDRTAKSAQQDQTARMCTLSAILKDGRETQNKV